jgi:hypothetical protein
VKTIWWDFVVSTQSVCNQADNTCFGIVSDEGDKNWETSSNLCIWSWDKYSTSGGIFYVEFSIDIVINMNTHCTYFFAAIISGSRITFIATWKTSHFAFLNDAFFLVCDVASRIRR